MEIQIKKLRKKDTHQAIQFAIIGMHFDWYLENKFLLNLYGRYFWYLELTRATQVIAAYAEDELLGILLADMRDEKKKSPSFWQTLYVKIVEFFQRLFYKESVGIYDETNKMMFQQYSKENTADGEIIFLAANPKSKMKGIGSKLLSELEARNSEKKVFLYTDNACSYQFYEHRGFERACEEKIVLDLGNKKVPLTCLLYSKVLGS
ncbi:GNAT family N-acetyltransferase [Listeria ilorinensis]|uniref:GNAT family N-acetyltransferase n=1 Tax=Listeria ilorinensis TaxID=2867439 RepID=UPI001EF5AEC2|nr:GNAT family N-acetyltransferase [Listeria ilorinensis]